MSEKISKREVGELPYPGQRRPTMDSGTYYGVICLVCGPVRLTREQYDYQMNRPNQRWSCPQCGGVAHWDDDRYEASLEEEAMKFPQGKIKRVLLEFGDGSMELTGEEAERWKEAIESQAIFAHIHGQRAHIFSWVIKIDDTAKSETQEDNQ